MKAHQIHLWICKKQRLSWHMMHRRTSWKHGKKLSRVLDRSRPRCDPSVALLWVSQPILNGRKCRKGGLQLQNCTELQKKFLKCNIQSLLSLIMGYENKCQSKCWVLKVRTGNRTHCERWINENVQKKSKNLWFDECQIFLDIDYPFLAASNDLPVSCSCSGECLVEFKCPLNSKCCKIVNVFFLVNANLFRKTEPPTFYFEKWSIIWSNSGPAMIYKTKMVYFVHIYL